MVAFLAPDEFVLYGAFGGGSWLDGGVLVARSFLMLLAASLSIGNMGRGVVLQNLLAIRIGKLLLYQFLSLVGPLLLLRLELFVPFTWIGQLFIGYLIQVPGNIRLLIVITW